MMPAQEALKGAKVFLAGFSQHPASGFLNEVFGII
jgi:hypothetical protein